MRYRSSSSLSYRNVLIAAGLAVGLGMGAASADAAAAPQPRSDGQSPNGQSPNGSVDRLGFVPPALARAMARGSRR
jgi:hypothetical protein